MLCSCLTDNRHSHSYPTTRFFSERRGFQRVAIPASAANTPAHGKGDSKHQGHHGEQPEDAPELLADGGHKRIQRKARNAPSKNMPPKIASSFLLIGHAPELRQ